MHKRVNLFGWLLVQSTLLRKASVVSQRASTTKHPKSNVNVRAQMLLPDSARRIAEATHIWHFHGFVSAECKASVKRNVKLKPKPSKTKKPKTKASVCFHPNVQLAWKR